MLFSKKNSKKKNLLLSKLVEVFLTTGVIAMPWVAQASEIVRTDGGTTVSNPAGTVHDVYVGKKINDNVGANSFEKFNVSQGNIVNMHMKRYGQSDSFNTLVNFVNSRININGTVNAIKNAKIGGNLYFLSADGMAVGKSGVINAGSLHVMTPTKKWMQDNGNVNISTSALDKVLIDEVPINEDGTVVVMGTVNAVDNITVKAGKINIGVSEEGTDFNPAKMTTGTTDFAGLVNIEGVDSGLNTSGENLKLVKTGNGNIVIAAVADGADNDTDNLEAIVRVDGGSEINARDGGMVSVTATAIRKAEDKFDVESLLDNITNLNIFVGAFETGGHDMSTTVAKVEIGTSGLYNNEIKSAGSVKIEAVAHNEYDTNIPIGMNAGVAAANMIGQFGLENLGFAHAGIINEATVTIGETTSVVAAGNIDVLADATTSAVLDVGSLPLSIVSKLFPDSNFSPSAVINILESNNKAEVTVNGDLTSTSVGNISLTANADNTVHSTASAGGFGEALVKAVLGGFGFNIVLGGNMADVVVGNNANITTKIGDITAESDAVTSMIMKTDVSASKGNLATFTFNYMEYDNKADVTIDGKITTITLGDIDVNANAKYTDNTMVGDASAGLGALLSPVMDKLNNLISGIGQSISKNTSDTVYDWIFGSNDSIAPSKAFLDFAVERIGLTLPNLPGINETADTIVSEFTDKVSIGLSMGFMYETNEATITLDSAAALVAKDNLTVKANAKMDDLHTAVYGTATVENYNMAGEGSGAFLKRDFTNISSVVIDSGTDIQYAVLEGSEVTVDAKSSIPYNRVNKMIQAIKDQAKLISDGIETMDLSDLSAEQRAILNKYLADMEAERAKMEEDLYKPGTNELKDEFCEGEQGYARMTERIDAFESSEAYVKYSKLITTGQYDAGSYTDANGVEHTFQAGNLKGDKTNWEDKVGGVFDIIGNAVDFVKPSSYVNFFVGSSNQSKAITDLFKGWGGEGGTDSENLYGEAGLSLGIDDAKNQAQVLIGKNARITANKIASTENHGVNIAAKADFDNISALYSASLFAKAMGLGANVSLLSNEMTNATIIAVAEDAKIESGNGIYINVDSDTQNIGVNFGAAKSENAIAAAVVLLNTESDSVISVDDEVSMDALNDIKLEGYNNALTVAVSGSLAWGTGTGAGGLALGLSNLNRANIVGIADNDAIFSYYGKNVFTENDDDTVRMRKVLANRTFKTLEEVQNFFGEKQTNEVKGTIKARNLFVNTVSDGTTVNVAADVADPPKPPSEKPKDGYEWVQEEIPSEDIVDYGKVCYVILIKEEYYDKVYDKNTGYLYTGGVKSKSNPVRQNGVGKVKFWETKNVITRIEDKKKVTYRVLVTQTPLGVGAIDANNSNFYVITNKELKEATGDQSAFIGGNHKNHVDSNTVIKRYKWVQKPKKTDPETTTQPPETTTDTPTNTPETTTQPPETTHPETTTQPPETTHPETTTQPPETTHPETTTQPHSTT